MAREKYQTLTEQMFYILLCLCQERCGTDIMDAVREMTQGRVIIGPGTLYTLLDSFHKDGLIEETRVEGRKRSYRITATGHHRLEQETMRLRAQLQDFERWKGDANAHAQKNSTGEL